MDILHYEIYVLFVMKSLDVAYDVGEYYLFKDSLLGCNCLFHLFLSNILLVKTLYCKKIIAKLVVFDQIYLTKLSLAQLFQVGKVLETERGLTSFLFLKTSHLFQ